MRRSERLWDAVAALFVAGGAGLFFFARHALNALANGTYSVPNGVTYVSRTDLHVAQTRLAIWMVGTGMAFGILAAIRHRLRKNA